MMIHKDDLLTPQKIEESDEEILGITIRDYTAIQAMTAMLSTENEEEGYYSDNDKAIKILTSRSYKIADAMIKESQK